MSEEDLPPLLPAREIRRWAGARTSALAPARLPEMGMTSMVSDLTQSAFKSTIANERIAKCKEMAAEAEMLAKNATGEMRSGYLSLADRWVALAHEMEVFSVSDDTGPLQTPSNELGAHSKCFG